MKKFIILVVFALSMFFTGVTITSAESPWDKTNIDPNKNWTIKFSTEVDGTTINNDNIYLFNSSGKVVEEVKVSTGNPINDKEIIKKLKDNGVRVY